MSKGGKRVSIEIKIGRIRERIKKRKLKPKMDAKNMSIKSERQKKRKLN